MQFSDARSQLWFEVNLCLCKLKGRRYRLALENLESLREQIKRLPVGVQFDERTSHERGRR